MNSHPIPGTFPLDLALKAAYRALSTISPICERIDVAGSVRRQKSYCHDVDLVLWPKFVLVAGPQQSLFDAPQAWPQPRPLLDLLENLGWYHTTTPYPRIIHLANIDKDGDVGRVPVELYLTEPSGENYGALWQMRTGCAEFNESLAVRAQKMHMKYVAGHGIYRGEQRVDDGTEDGIFRALEIAPTPPEKRVADFHYCAKGAKP